MNLWKRDWSLRIGTVMIRPSDGHLITIRFEVSKTSGREPNKASISIANLSDARVSSLAAMDDPDIELQAGYVGAMDTIFSGDAKDIWTTRDTPDRWTKIEAQDGGRSYRSAELDQGWDESVSLATIITSCAQAMGVGIGNAASAAARAELDSGGAIFPTGVTISGPAWRSLDRICRSCGLRWSVQSGVLQISEVGRAAVVQAVRLSPSTGLIGSPSRGAKDRRTRKYTYSATSLMRPGLYPGRVVRIESQELTANLLVQTTHHVGDTTGEDWHVDMELQEYDS